MEAHKYRELDPKELRLQLDQMQEQLFRLRFQIRMGQGDVVKKLREVKKDRARALTVLRERELAEKKGGA
jgi:large subunit ribosomal protein L29